VRLSRFGRTRGLFIESVLAAPASDPEKKQLQQLQLNGKVGNCFGFYVERRNAQCSPYDLD
jgi:hypothetical protein